MEIDITPLAELDAFPLSHSAAEGGQTAGRDTWYASLDQAEETPILDTPEKLQAMRDFALSSGGWTDEEIAEWTPQEINALFIQWIAGDVRQCPATDGGNAESLEEIDWSEYEAQSSEGRISSNLFRADDGRVLFSLSN